MLVLLQFSSNLASLTRTRTSTRPLPVTFSTRATARVLCSALCFSSWLADFWVRGTDVKWVVRILSGRCVSAFELVNTYYVQSIQKPSRSLKTTMPCMWTRIAHCVLSCTLASFVLLLLRVCDIRIESRIALPSTLIVRCTLAVFRRLCVDAVLVLRIFSGKSEGKRLRELAVSGYFE